MVRAYAPYGIIIGVFVICQIPVVKSLLDKATIAFTWPGLNVIDADGDPSTLTKFTLNLLTTPGTQMLVAGFLTMVALQLSAPRALKAYGATLHQLRWAIVTVMTVLALAFVMNLSGQTITLGTWMAAAGGVFALLSPILGWLGVAVTGSDTSANSLFGALQVTAANQAGLSDVLMAASNSSGGVAGQDDLAAEPRHRRRRGRSRRQGGRHLPPRHPVEPGVPGLAVHPVRHCRPRPCCRGWCRDDGHLVASTGGRRHAR